MPEQIVSVDTKIAGPFTLKAGLIFSDQYVDDFEITYSAVEPEGFVEQLLKSPLGKMIRRAALDEGPLEKPFPCPWWMNLYGHNVQVIFPDGSKGTLLPGMVVLARTVTGICCGRFEVHTFGHFGFMPVYKDDPYEPGIQGPQKGDDFNLFLQIGAKEWGIDNQFIWTGWADKLEVNEMILLEG